MKITEQYTLVKIFLTAIMLLVSAGISAHHSTSGFALDKTVRIEGTVTQFRWTNPHASIKMEAIPDSDQEQTAWTIEMTAPNVLLNQGWKRNSLKKGDHVVVFANPLTDGSITLNDGSKGGYYKGVILANGEILGEVPQQ